MALWLVRAGSYGEFEEKFLTENRIYVTWDRLSIDLGKLLDRVSLLSQMEIIYPESKPKTLGNWVSQVWPFAHKMEKGDLVVLPLKSARTIYIGEITGDYKFSPKGPNPFFHSRSVKWIGESIPRTAFGQDLLYSFGAFLTICRIHRNNAEKRILAMRANNWAADPNLQVDQEATEASDNPEIETDLEQSGLDAIAKFIGDHFKEHGLTRLVEAVLRAQGYTTYLSPAGPDGGADILASSGPLGFGNPQLCVEVKSGTGGIDRSTVDKLLGAMSKFGAAHGLFVSWSGYKKNVQKELAQSFFKLRLWNQKDLLDAIFAHYDQLDDDLKAELPLKRIWTVAKSEEV